MRPLFSIGLAALALWAVDHEASAGQFALVLRSAEPLGGSSQPDVSIDSDDLELSSSRQSVTFRPKTAEMVLSKATIRVAEPPRGYLSSVYEMEVPYHWATSSRPITVYGALSNDRTDDASVVRFADALSRGADLEDTGNVFLLHQRTKQIFRARKALWDAGARPQGQDVTIAYYLILTARELATRRNVVVDQVTREAMGWLRTVVSLKPRYYAPRFAPAPDVAKIAIDLDLQESTVYADLVNRIEVGIRHPSIRESEQACARALYLHQAIREMPEEDYRRITRQGAVHLRVATNAAYCLARSFEKKRRANVSLSENDLKAAGDVSADMARLLPDAPEGPAKVNALNRQQEMERYLPA